MRPLLSLVLPIFNEAETIDELARRLGELRAAVDGDTEVIFVDDGSRDGSLAMLRALAEREQGCRVLSLSRNFGHQAAITAGLDHAEGEAVVVLDADLQDPPEVVIEMLAKWREGFDVVYGRRRTRDGETLFKRITASLFYRTMSWLVPIEVPLDAGDFRLMSRRVVLVLRELKECHRFVRGLVAWAGFDQAEVLFDRPARLRGTTKYSLGKMFRFAADGITSFSVVPLRIATGLGLSIALVSFLLGAWAIYVKLATDDTVPGWATTFVMVSMMSSVQLVMIGILGEYVGRIYEQVKRRPLYVLRSDLSERRLLDRGPEARDREARVGAEDPVSAGDGAARGDGSSRRTPAT